MLLDIINYLFNYIQLIIMIFNNIMYHNEEILSKQFVLKS